MKNYRIYFVISALSLLFVTNACLDLGDIKNTERYPSEGVWNNVNLVNAYLTDLYSVTLPGGWPRNGGLADTASGTIGDNWMNADNGTMFTWPYGSIRNINLLLEEIDKGTLEDSFKKTAKAQAYFLRAWEYFKMVRVLGGVPIIKKVQKQTDGEALKVKRNTTKETFDFIIEDLNKAIKDLPDKTPASEFGRIDKAIAKAFKGRVLLTKASPLFGPNAKKYWNEAYAATKEAKEFADKQGFGLLDKYSDVFQTDGHKEAILAIVSTENRRNLRAEHCVRPLSESENCTGGDNPIWGLVKSYPMKNGKKITDASSGYKEQEFWKK